jgi:Xaa-Pro aminopeptidase/3-dehydroquinate synthetase
VVTQADIPMAVSLPEHEVETYVIGTGEGAKTLATIETLTRGFARQGVTRRDVVVGVGGGMVTDIAGFAAASWHRGTPVVHVATTLLGMVDAAIGGKTGVNLPEGKNLVGAFWQPSGVVCDLDALATLPEREMRCGLGEMSKYHFLTGDDLLAMPMAERIARCVEIKADVVASDEREGGRRALLNYGHTLAHALETTTDHELAHGEAVAVGLVFAAELALELGRIDEARVAEHRRVVAGEYGLRITPPEGLDVDELIEVMGATRRRSTGSRSCSTDRTASRWSNRSRQRRFAPPSNGSWLAMSDTFAPIDHRRRVETLQRVLGVGLGNGCDALLFTDLVDVRWLTGFTGSNGWAVLRADDLILGTDGRYGERARAETAQSGATVFAETTRAALHDRLIAAVAGASVALDPSTTSQAEWSRLAEQVSLEPMDSFVAQQRRIKDAAEIERMTAAAAAADAALAEVEPILFATVDHPVTEADIRNELEYRMRLHGADDRSYETIVAAGPDHAARPHHDATGRRIVEGDTVIIDVGALVDGYHSDMTRSYVIGEPTEAQRQIYALVEASHAAGTAALRPGISARELDSVCRDVFESAGHLDWYLHGTGHGVGLVIHEPPFHSQVSEDELVVGNVVTVEPGLYRVGFGGFRIEDLLVVTETGSEPLTHAVPRPFPG